VKVCHGRPPSAAKVAANAGSLKVEFFQDPVSGAPVTELEVYTHLAGLFEQWRPLADRWTAQMIYQLEKEMGGGPSTTYGILAKLDLLERPPTDFGRRCIQSWLGGSSLVGGQANALALLDSALALAKEKGRYEMALTPGEAKWMWEHGYKQCEQQLADTYGVLPEAVSVFLGQASKTPEALRPAWNSKRWLPTFRGALSKVDLLFYLSAKEKALLNAKQPERHGLHRPPALKWRSALEIYHQLDDLGAYYRQLRGLLDPPDLLDATAGELGVDANQLMQFLKS
jgi:hypothetical protein